MILSHEHKFIFLGTKKTAGTSIELALSELCGPDDVITPLTREDEARRAGQGRPELAATQLVEVTAPAEMRLVQILSKGLRLLQSNEG